MDMTNSQLVVAGRCLCAIAICSCGTLVARASIVVPSCPGFTLEMELGDCTAAGIGSTQSSSLPAAPLQRRNRNQSPSTRLPGDFAQGASSTGTSANSYGSGGTASTVWGVRAVASALTQDSAATGWLFDEYRLAVPMAAINSLLRPPQDLQCIWT
jgi:hypothetical protein